MRTGIEGRVAIVTGAAGGIGAAVVQALQAEGARVAALDREGSPYVVDVRKPDEVESALTAIEEQLGPIEIGVNVAGVLSTTLVLDTDLETWRDVFAVNAEGVFTVSRALARRMVPRRRGAIVTVSSNAAGVPRHGMAAYAASKAAATMFTRCLGLELAEFGIRCNIVAPGSTRTPMLASMWTGGRGEAALIDGSPAAFKPGIPLRKIAEPADVADAVVFLVSDRASHITMAELYVDGGATLKA